MAKFKVPILIAIRSVPETWFELKSGSTLVSPLTKVQPAGLIHFGGGTPSGSRLSSGVASQNAVCQENLHEDQSRGSMDYGCVGGAPAGAQDLGRQFMKFGDGIYAYVGKNFKS